MNENRLEVPWIGKNDEMVMNLRLRLSAQILGHLAGTDYATQLHKALEEKDTLDDQSEELQFRLNVGMVGRAAVGYADALLISLGIARPRP